MRKTRELVGFLFIASALLIASAARAANQRYIVVLDPRGKLFDTDVIAAGGTVEERFMDHFVVTLPNPDALRGKPGVKYVQPIGGSRDLTPLPDDIRTASPSRARIEATPPTWGPLSYSYDAAGNIYAIGGDTYAYDLDSRLSRWTKSGDTSATETYAYDPYGNMTSYKRFDQTSAATISVDATTNHLNSDTYDHGNDTSFGTTAPQTTMVYDSINMPVQTGGAAGTAYFVYTADDERIGVLTADTWNWSLRGFDHEVLRQFRSSNSAPASPWVWVEDYVYRGSQLLAAERVAEEGGRRHLHLDHLGTPRLITGTNGMLVSQHDYTPFGLEYTQQNQEIVAGFDREDPKRFTGHERDYLGYSDFAGVPDYMHARGYAATLGRFLSVDPVAADPSTPETFNRYVYVANNPTNYVDPRGMDLVTIPSQGPLTLISPVTGHSQYLMGIFYGFWPHDIYGNWDPAKDLSESTYEWLAEVAAGQFQPIPAGALTDAASNVWNRTWYSHYRMPDYFSGTVNVGTWAGVTAQVTVARTGSVWFGLGGNLGKSITTISGSVVGGYLNQSAKPTTQRLESYISGWSLGVGGGYFVGGNRVWGLPGVGKEVGAVSPQVGVTAVYSWRLPFSWPWPW